MTITVGENRGIIPKEGENPKLYFIVTGENVENVNKYDTKDVKYKEWLFTDAMTNEVIQEQGYTAAILNFTETDGDLKMDVSLMRNGGGRRTRKVKRSKSSKKRPTRRGRSSNARKARKARKARTTRRK